MNKQFWDYTIEYMHDLANRINPDPSHVNVTFLKDFSNIYDMEDIAGSCILHANDDFSSFDIQILFSIEGIKMRFNEYQYKVNNIIYSRMNSLKEIVMHEMRHAEQYIYGIKKYGLENTIILLTQNEYYAVDEFPPEIEVEIRMANKLTIDFRTDMTSDESLEWLYNELTDAKLKKIKRRLVL